MWRTFIQVRPCHVTGRGKHFSKVVQAWNAAMPPTWDDATVSLECNRKFDELVSPHFQTTELTNELSRSCGYVAFAARYRSRDECYGWSRCDHCKLVKLDGSRISENDLVHAGWEPIPIWKSMNRENMVNREAGITRLFVDLNLPYHACILLKCSERMFTTRTTQNASLAKG